MLFAWDKKTKQSSKQTISGHQKEGDELQPYALFRKFGPQTVKFPYAYVVFALVFLSKKKDFLNK